MALTVGQFLRRSRDTAQDPYDASKSVSQPGPEPSTGYTLLGERYNPVGTTVPGAGALDPVLYSRHVERLARQPARTLLMGLTQTALTAQNVVGAVWNPLLVAPPPGVPLLPALDLPPGGDTSQLTLRLGQANGPGVRGETPPRPTAADPTGFAERVSPGFRETRRAFDRTRTTLSNTREFLTTGRVDKLYGGPLENSMGTRFDNAFGWTEQQTTKAPPDDDELYVPLYITDMRQLRGAATSHRMVILRPVITELSENFAPQWTTAQYMGRVDPVATYVSTTRTISIGLRLVALSPEDIRVIYQKLFWLSSMVYPEFDSDLALNAGPVVRLRVGNVIDARSPVHTDLIRGLPGVITSMDFDYTNSLWELEKDWKVPREVTVSISFLVLHDAAIGVSARTGDFGAVPIPRRATHVHPHEAFRSVGPSDSRLLGQGTNPQPAPAAPSVASSTTPNSVSPSLSSPAAGVRVPR